MTSKRALVKTNFFVQTNISNLPFENWGLLNQNAWVKDSSVFYFLKISARFSRPGKCQKKV